MRLFLPTLIVLSLCVTSTGFCASHGKVPLGRSAARSPNRLPSPTNARSHRQRGSVPATRTAARSAPKSQIHKGPPIPKGGPHPDIWSSNRNARRLASKEGGAMFRADVGKTKAQSRSGHRAAANRQLSRAMGSDPGLRKQITSVFGQDAWSRVQNGRNPPAAQWDHSTRNRRDLILRTSPNHGLITKKQGRTGGGWARFYQKK